jgi:PIN domain nuclease of toxin-antitoxin system
MELLLDTQPFIYFLNGDKKLSAGTIQEISDLNNTCYVSIASIWEIAIKLSLGKLKIHGEFEDIGKFVRDNEIEILPIHFSHIQRLLTLDFHHRDPFDRIIIAQGIEEDLTLVTHDDIFKAYSIKTRW